MASKSGPFQQSTDRPDASRSHGAAPRKWPSAFFTLSLCFLVWVFTFSARFGPGALARHFRSCLSIDTTEEQKHEGFRWSDITPSRTLQYTPCWHSFQCARLSVPLKRNATPDPGDDGPRAAIAIIKLPARVPVTDARYGGPVVINPGGPGESGIYQVLSDGKHLQTIVDGPGDPGDVVLDGDEAGKYFDIVSFDPRGVNNTTPALGCFPNAFNQQAWLLRFPDIGLLWDSESLVGLERARAAALGASCSAGRAGEDILPYLNTPQVVEDVVEIIEREGEWRAGEVQRLVLSPESHGQDDLGGEPKLDIVRRTAYRPGEEKLQYWGMSYGTTLGSTFAAMHPEKVARVVLDGNMDPAEHYQGGFEKSLQDADKVIVQYSKYCFTAGPEKCPLFEAASPEAIEARFTSIMSSFKTSPVAVPLPGDLGPEVITHGDAHLLLLTSMYFSFAFAERFWGLLPVLEASNGTHPEMIAMASRKQAGLAPATQPGQGPGCAAGPGGDPDSCLPYQSWAGAFRAVSCMDAGGGPANLTRAALGAKRAALAAQSRWASPTWSRNLLSCEGLAARPAWRPRLGFDRPGWGKTSHPLLFVGNTHDPATPLANARRVSGGLFPGSVVLQQDSEGHCSHASPCLCTAKAVREYFQTGRLPRPGTVCQPERRPFLGCVREGGCQFGGHDARLWEALVQLADPFGLAKTGRAAGDLYRDVWRSASRVARN